MPLVLRITALDEPVLSIVMVLPPAGTMDHLFVPLVS
jgi:hypothetical protein